MMMQDNLDDAVAALVRAVRDQGVNPEYHFKVVTQVGFLWPSLMTALMRVVTAHDENPDYLSARRIELADGIIEYRNRFGDLHNENGPAVLATWGEMWCQRGRKHRVGGPAVVRYDGANEWWVDGEPQPAPQKLTDQR